MRTFLILIVVFVEASFDVACAVAGKQGAECKSLDSDGVFYCSNFNSWTEISVVLLQQIENKDNISNLFFRPQAPLALTSDPNMTLIMDFFNHSQKQKQHYYNFK
jgi:hypothetical protein